MKILLPLLLIIVILPLASAEYFTYCPVGTEGSYTHRFAVSNHGGHLVFEATAYLKGDVKMSTDMTCSEGSYYKSGAYVIGDNLLYGISEAKEGEPLNGVPYPRIHSCVLTMKQACFKYTYLNRPEEPYVYRCSVGEIALDPALAKDADYIAVGAKLKFACSGDEAHHTYDTEFPYIDPNADYEKSWVGLWEYSLDYKPEKFAPSVCGDGTCDCYSPDTENCQNCPADCECYAGCAPGDPMSDVRGCLNLCGDGNCDYWEPMNENCLNCPGDCQCSGWLGSSQIECNPCAPDASSGGCSEYPYGTYGDCSEDAASGNADTPPPAEDTPPPQATQPLTVEISTDKESYLIGETVYGTIKVTNSTGGIVPSADVRVVATRLGSGKSKEMTGSTDAMGETSMNFVWGKDDAGKVIKEGKLRLDVTATKANYLPGSASKTLSGCGDLECSAEEDCVDCEEDCGCGDLICDPSSDYKDATTFCAPKTAYVLVSEDLSAYHRWWTWDDQKLIRKRYASLGYTVAPTMDVDQIREISSYLSRPSVKAIAYFGHGNDPAPGVAAIPSMETSEATTGPYPIRSAVADMTKEPKGYKYTCQFVTHAAKFNGVTKDRIEQIAQGRVNSPNLDYAFIFACYSLDDMSLRDYLLKSSGTYWGYRGKLPGNADLIPSIKP